MRRPIQLPYRKVINWYFSGFFVIPFGIFTYSYIRHDKPVSSLLGVQVYLLPALFCLLGLTPLFKFKSDEKVSSEKALIKIPVLEFYVLFLAAMFSAFAFGGICCYLEGNYKEGQGMLLWGGLGTVILLWALNSKWIWFKDQMIPEIVRKKVDVRKHDAGGFTYTDGGFQYDGDKKQFYCKWDDIEGIIAYKTDNYTYDTIHLIIKKTNGEELNINEDTPGWFIYIDTLPDKLDGMDALWKMSVMMPAFEESITMVYEKGKNLMAYWGNKELIGLWKTADDGGMHMISGQALEFKRDGTGIFYSWATTDPNPYDDKVPILWERVDDHTIRIRETKNEAAWATVPYEIKPYKGAYDIAYRRMTSPAFAADEYFKEGFWKVLGALMMVEQAEK